MAVLPHAHEAPRANETLRPGTSGDAKACGRICYEACAVLAHHHGFQPDIPSPEQGVRRNSPREALSREPAAVQAACVAGSGCAAA